MFCWLHDVRSLFGVLIGYELNDFVCFVRVWRFDVWFKF